MSTPEYLTTVQVAARFQVTRTSVNRWVRAGKLRALRTPGGTLRFLAEDIDAFLAPALTEDESVRAAS